jgi:hypothetical protein
VVATIVHDDEDDMTKLTVTSEDGSTGTVDATSWHPVWVDTEGQFVNIGGLMPGQRLASVDGTSPKVTDVDRYTHFEPVYDLTIDDVHTYDVVVGNTSILVHNCDLDVASEDNLYRLATAGGSPKTLSPAGRSIQKHSAPSRSQEQRDNYDYGAKNNSDRNEVGDILIRKILTDPNASRRINHSAPAHYGGSQLGIRMGNGIGARWSLRGGSMTFEDFL